MTEQPTCAQRIGEHMAGRAEHVDALLRAYGGEEYVPDPDGTYIKDDRGRWVPKLGEVLNQEDAGERLSELPLAVSVERMLRVELSTGGPADYITAVLFDDGTVRTAAYHFADWFDHAEQPISEGSPLWRLAEYYAESVEGLDGASGGWAP